MTSLVIVDDNEMVGAPMADYLRCNGYVASAFTCGRRAIANLREHPVDVVITDIYMPDFDGMELIQACRLMESPPIILAITGGMPTVLKVARMMGAERIMFKPIDPSQLLKVLNELSASRSVAAGARVSGMRLTECLD